MPLRGDDEIKRLVLSSVSRQAVPIYRIAEKVDVSVQTASKYCHILEAEGRIMIENFGNMKLVRRK